MVSEGANGLRRLLAVEARHVTVEEDGVEAIGARGIDRRNTVPHGHDAVPQLLEDAAEIEQTDFIVVSNKDVHRHDFH